MKKFFDKIVHGGDYNPDQWIDSRELWDEDMRLMRLAKINSATVGIFSWSLLEPSEGVYDFSWLDEIMDKLYQNGIYAILATPSGARPAWLAERYPEVLRVREDNTKYEFGVRHNHCMTSPIYRQKVQELNRRLAERYKNHPALKMWHISNEYSGECHCESCQAAFREWLKREYNNDLDLLNFKWWGNFWSHKYTDWSQISSPKSIGENHVSAQKLCWDRFVSDSHISFYENEIKPLRELTPEIPITTNLMRMYDGIDYQKLSRSLDLVSWDNYPRWAQGNDIDEAANVAFCHDAFRSMKGGQPFFMMESTPSIVNWNDINKLPPPLMQQLTAVQAVAHGADSVQYFQWRKSRGGHEKFHGAVVDHCGHENTRVFREVASTGALLEGLSSVVGSECRSRVAVIYDWENAWAIKHFCGFNNVNRDYLGECVRWYKGFWQRQTSVDVIAMDDDFFRYDLIIAPFLYMLKDGTIDRIEQYVKNGGNFVGTYMLGTVDKDDLCYLGGFPAEKLREVFGVWHEETDSLLPNASGSAEFNGRAYATEHICDIIHSEGAEALGHYTSDFYSGMPAVTCNKYGRGSAYYFAFRNDSELYSDAAEYLLARHKISPDTDIDAPRLVIRKRGDLVFCMNFSSSAEKLSCHGYINHLTNEAVEGSITLKAQSYLILKKKD